MSVPDRPSRTQDEWIALRCQAGDNTGFEDLVALMERPLLYYAAKLTGNAQTAHDVLQDVWVKVFSGIRGLKTLRCARGFTGSPTGWRWTVSASTSPGREQRKPTWTDSKKRGIFRSREMTLLRSMKR